MKKQQFTRLAKAARELAAALSDCERRMGNAGGALCGGACETCGEMKGIRRGMSIMAGGLYSIPAAGGKRDWGLGTGDWENPCPSVSIRGSLKKDSAEFAAFWSAYPKSCPRRENRKKCAARWSAGNLDKEAKEIREFLEHKRGSDQWLADGGIFIPAPLVFLHAEGWREDWRAKDAPPLAPLDRAEAAARDRSLADLRAVERGEDESDEDAAARFEALSRHFRSTPFAALRPAIDAELEAVRRRFRLPEKFPVISC